MIILMIKSVIIIINGLLLFWYGSQKHISHPKGIISEKLICVELIFPSKHFASSSCGKQLFRSKGILIHHWWIIPNIAVLSVIPSEKFSKQVMLFSHQPTRPACEGYRRILTFLSDRHYTCEGIKLSSFLQNWNWWGISLIV